jgi:kinesin family member 12
MAIEGFSTTAFCYGQTGSGKTHTLTGPQEIFVGRPDPAHPGHGLIFHAFCYLFQLLQERKDVQFVLKASFLEIYNEKVSAQDTLSMLIVYYKHTNQELVAY